MFPGIFPSLMQSKFHPSKLINPEWAASPGGRDGSEDSQQHTLLRERKQSKGSRDQGRVTRLISLHGPCPGLQGGAEKWRSCQGPPHPCLLQTLPFFDISEDLSSPDLSDFGNSIVSTSLQPRAGFYLLYSSLLSPFAQLNSTQGEVS